MDSRFGDAIPLRLALAVALVACSTPSGKSGRDPQGSGGHQGAMDAAVTGGAGGSAGGAGGTGAPVGGTDGSAPADVTRSPDGGGNAGDLAPADPGRLIWPNQVSSKNSDQWLVDNHTKITEMHPRFLIIDFANGYTDAQVMARFNLHKQGIMDGSTYHGYKDPDSKPFMIWEVFKHVSLKDSPVPAGWMYPNSSKMPRRNNGIDFGRLFSQEYADLYQVPDPANPGRYMKICEMFQSGLVNDILVAFVKDPPDDNVPEVVELHQVYDANDVKIPGRFDQQAGNGSWGPGDVQIVMECGRSVRLNFLEMDGNLTNAEVLGHNFEHIGTRAMPRFWAMFSPFANMDMRKRYGTRFNDWYGVCQYGAACLTYPDQNSVVYPDGMISPFDQGCGNAHFPPNGTRHYDKANTQVVLSTCENYGLQNGPDGKDLQTPYSLRTLDPWQNHPVGRAMRGGAWFIYWWQNWPGYNNKARMPDGTPMKNWWVYLYY